MTSKLKCPFCGKELTEYPVWGFGCGNTNCACSEGVVGSEQLWQALIQAKQDLETISAKYAQFQKSAEIARKALKDITIVRCGLEDFEPKAVTMTRIAEKALKQIEHKEDK